MGRLDYVLNDKQRVFARYFRTEYLMLRSSPKLKQFVVG
jgi:hypothetical protein